MTVCGTSDTQRTHLRARAKRLGARRRVAFPRALLDPEGEDPAGDHEPLDVARALADLGELRVAQEAPDRVVLDVAVAAMEQQRRVRRSAGDLRRVELRLRGREPVVPSLVAQPRRPIDEGPGRLDLRRHVGDAKGDRLERADRPAELLALPDVRDSGVERRLGEPQGKRADRDPAAIEDREERPEALALLAQEVVGRDARAVEAELA